MLYLLASTALGVAVAALLWSGLRQVFDHPTLARTNVHGRMVPTAGGLVIALAILVPVAMAQLVMVLRWDDAPRELLAGWTPLLIATMGFGLLGLVDDLLGDGGSRGFRGHLVALASGTVTTGAVKLLGGGVVAILAVAHTRSITGPRWQFAVDVALVALGANLANLFDRAPGRVTKVAVVCAVALVFVAPLSLGDDPGAAVPPVAALFVIGAAIGVVVPELREQMMLGDTGANVVGAALGLAAVMALSGGARVGVVVVLLVLNLLSERVSFSRVIAATPGLRQFDALGRARE